MVRICSRERVSKLSFYIFFKQTQIFEPPCAFIVPHFTYLLYMHIALSRICCRPIRFPHRCANQFCPLSTFLLRCKPSNVHAKICSLPIQTPLISKTRQIITARGGKQSQATPNPIHFVTNSVLHTNPSVRLHLMLLVPSMLEDPRIGPSHHGLLSP
jgi:hypothetical protein